MRINSRRPGNRSTNDEHGHVDPRSVGDKTGSLNRPPSQVEAHDYDRSARNSSCDLITPHVGSAPSSPPTPLFSGESSDSETGDSIVQQSLQQNTPWLSPRVLSEEKEKVLYSRLQRRLANIPTRNRQRRQKLYIDLWSGQHWLGLALTGLEKPGMLIPVSNDTALSVSMTGSYKVLNPAAFSV